MSTSSDLVGLHWEPWVAELLEKPTAPGRYEVFCLETGIGGRGAWGPVEIDLDPTSEFMIE